MQTKISALILFSICILNAPSFAQNDITTLKNHLKADALQDFGFRTRTENYLPFQLDKARDYLTNLQKDGSWPDVDYQDHDNNWSPLYHLNRMLTMTVSYYKPSSPLYQDQQLMEGIVQSLEYWYTVNPVCDNWYKNEIAKQFYFNVMGLLLENDIEASLHEKIVKDLTAKPTMTGSNRTLVAISTFYRGVLENNPERIRAGLKGVTDPIKITTEEGVQPDYSFHQHGAFIYNGNYGLNFLQESIWLATMVDGTRFAYDQEKIKILRDYYLKGTRWMVRGGLVDYNVRGRQIGRTDAFDLAGDQLFRALDDFMIADPEHKNKYQTSKRRIENREPQEITGNKHFWRSDYTAHHRQAYFTSLKMCSERTVGIELNMNSENKMGYWLPYGLTYIYRRGNEYQGIFPVWDWARLPGVTSPHKEIAITDETVAHTQQTSFVGGVSHGKYGVSAMDFSKDQTKAKKAWFWFDDVWVALGTGIQSDHEAPIVTGVNQTLGKGDVVVDGQQFSKKEASLKNPGWVLHDSVGYIFPGNQTVKLKKAVQSGNLQRMYGLGKDTVYSEEVFSLWYDHGVRPNNGSYEYMVMPGTSAARLDRFVNKRPIQVLVNNSEIQAVAHEPLSLTGIAFHQAGTFKVHNDLSMTVDQPVLVLLDEEKGEMTVSDPTQQLKQVEITLKMNDGPEQTKTVVLPEDEFAGRGVTVALRTFN